MKRRLFVCKALTLTSLPLLPFSSNANLQNNFRHKQKIKPKRLKKGDTIGLISPGSYISDTGLEKAVKNIESLDLNVKLSQNIRAKRGYNAGTDQERLSDLHQMFEDKQVNGIWCARGGYGCSRLLPKINYRLIRKNPKILVGYSDITALLNTIFYQTRVVGFHGPVASSDFTPYVTSHIQNVLFEPQNTYTFSSAQENLNKEDSNYHPQLIQPGIATGHLVGGNLSLISALAGTSFIQKDKKHLIFLEDIGEKPYRIDRMLTQLRQSGYFKNASGIVLGIFTDCEADSDDSSLTLLETLRDRLGDLNIPILYGMSIGHIANQCILPLGINATLNTDTATITLLESAVL